MKLTLLLTLLTVGSGLQAATIDNINGSATPPFVVYAGPLNIGWYYTPALSYTLNGISTNFEPVPNGTGTRTITLQIWTDRPAAGGALLGQGMFSANSQTGGTLGVTFPNVALSSASTYFVDFLNTQGMGVNLGQWANDANGNPHPSAGATTNLGGWYADGSTGTFPASGFNAGPAYYTTNTGNVNFSEPILNFQGPVVTSTTPEPATFGFVVIGGLGLFAGIRLNRRSVHRGIR